MRALVQRVRESDVRVGGVLHGKIGKGCVIFLGIKKGDGDEQARELAGRCANLRVFDDENGRMNLSLLEVMGEALVVSQFTLYADTRKGNRPGFADAAVPLEAEKLYESFVSHLRSIVGDARVSTGIFRSTMDVTIVNEGPVTILLETKPQF